jgi:AraC-like DNA-binding protein
MTAFQFNPVTPHPLLSPYIAKMWVFESSGRLPAEERKLIVPNANLKLTLTYRNGIAARVGGKDFLQQENELSLTGLIDTPVILDPHEDAATGTIIIEFNPLGAYRFFRLQFTEVQNEITDLTDLTHLTDSTGFTGNGIATLRSQLTETGDVQLKLQLLQNFLLKQLEKHPADSIYDHCINRITATNGLITVTQLEKETGYSARWLHRKFSEHLGTGAKNLAEIVRFKQFYQAYSSGHNSDDLKKHIYHYYYDQSHFLRAFKRFTGATPTELQSSLNELSTRNFRS